MPLRLAGRLEDIMVTGSRLAWHAPVPCHVASALS